MRLKLIKGRGRLPQQEPVPFKPMLPLRLKQSVSGKSDKTADVSCLQEMAVFMACLKQNEFDQSLCQNEIKIFQECYKNHVKDKIAVREMQKKGQLIPGDKKLGHRQVNMLLKGFPDP